MDDRLAVAPFVSDFAELVREWVALEALYVGGSLATGDYRAGVSDVDVVALVRGPFDAEDRRRLRREHLNFEQHRPAAVRLHCIYVDVQALADADAEHPMWSDRRVIDRRLSQIARVELARNGVAAYGAPPSAFFRDSDAAALRCAARAELAGYWHSAVGKPALWLSDWCVDLSLLTIARAGAAIREDRLLTKAEAIDRLGRYGVPDDLAHEISQRRDGITQTPGFLRRVKRARTARRLVSRAISNVLEATADRRPTDHTG